MGNLQLSMVSIGLCVGKPATVNGFYRPMRRARKPATVNGFYRPMRRAIGNLQLSMVSIGLCVGLGNLQGQWFL